MLCASNTDGHNKTKRNNENEEKKKRNQLNLCECVHKKRLALYWKSFFPIKIWCLDWKIFFSHSLFYFVFCILYIEDNQTKRMKIWKNNIGSNIRANKNNNNVMKNKFIINVVLIASCVCVVFNATFIEEKKKENLFVLRLDI